MSLVKKYQKSKDMKWSLRFNTHHPDGDSYYGIVSHIQRQFIVLMKHDEFEFNGTVILPKKVIKGCRDGKHEKCANEILHRSDNIKQFRTQRWLDRCENLKQVLAKLQQKDIWPAIEVIFELDGKVETELYIGKITRIEKNALGLYDYSSDGKWQEECEIKYDEIFKIEFGDSYTHHFNAYMRERLPKSLL